PEWVLRIALGLGAGEVVRDTVVSLKGLPCRFTNGGKLLAPGLRAILERLVESIAPSSEVDGVEADRVLGPVGTGELGPTELTTQPALASEGNRQMKPPRGPLFRLADAGVEQSLLGAAQEG